MGMEVGPMALATVTRPVPPPGEGTFELRGQVATADISPGAVVIRVPFSSGLNVRAVSQSEILSRLIVRPP
jgi:hypothetical protein